MATNLALDDNLIDEALKLGNHKTKREAVTAALKHYIRISKLAGFDAMVGRVDYYDNLPRKATRRRRIA